MSARPAAARAAAPPAPRDALASAAFTAAVLVACALRLHNALHYPPDWGFDASFNWSYIARLGRDWSLPDPEESWATSDPPLFFYAAAALLRASRALGAADAALRLVPLCGTLAGLAIAWLAHRLVRILHPADLPRARVAACLVLYLPAHIHVSAMVNEEIWQSCFASLAVFALATELRAERSAARALGAGVLAGLALLAKPTGGLALLALLATYALEAISRRRLRRGAALACICALAAGLTGGWFYLRNALRFGTLLPHQLPVHSVMQQMPPGSRTLLDFVSLPLATWSDPQLLNPALLHSVWGSTFATLWFDGHRYFLPLEGDGVRALGALTLALALLPSAAFAAGGLRALCRIARALRPPGNPAADLPLLALVPLGLLGYAAFAWRNPSYVVLKGSSLLALALPFSYYASEALTSWGRRSRSGAAWLLAAGVALAVCVVVGTSFGVCFTREVVPGLPWQEVPLR